MKVTVCQIDPRPGQVETFLEALAEHIASEASDFLLLPEMSFAGWLAGTDKVDPERWDDAVALHEKHIASLGVLGAKAIMGTRPIVTDAGSRRNEAYVWTVDKPVPAGFHQKYYLPDEPDYWEHTWYDRGPKEFQTAGALGMRLGVQICTEMWFFEWARHYGAARADLLCVPRATPHGNQGKWVSGGQTAAVCSGAYCLSSNLWAPQESDANLGGVGWITDPEGEVIATTDEQSPFATAEIDLDFARQSKATYPRYVPE